MPWTPVQFKQATASTAAFTSNTTTGNQIVVTSASDAAISSISISPGSGTFTKAVAVNTGAGGLFADIWECPNVTGGTTPTVTVVWALTPSFPNIVIYEFSGGNVAGTVDGTNTNQSATGTAVSTNSITPGTSGDLIVKVFTVNSTGNGTSQSGGWTELNPMTSGGISGYLVQSVAAAITGADTQTTTGAWCGAIAAFKPLAGTTWNATAFIQSDVNLVGPGQQGGGSWNGINLDSTWSSPRGVWNSPDFIVSDPSIVWNAVDASATTSSLPALVNHVATGMDITPVGTLTIPYPDAVLGGNCLICGVQCNSAGTITSVKDNLGNSFTNAVSITNATYSKTAGLYYLPNATAGVTGVVITFTGLTVNGGGYGVGHPHGVISQWYNITTSSPLDGSSSNNASTTAGSFTTTTGGDLIYEWGIDLSDNASGGAFNGTGNALAPGGGFTLLSADNQVGSCEQYQIQSSAGAINPTFTTTGGATWGSLAIALKAATAGTAPPGGIRIIGVQHTSFAGDAPTGGNYPNVISKIQFPCFGNLLVGLYQCTVGQITAITDSSSNTWSIPGSAVVSVNGQLAQIVYAAGAATGSNLNSISFTFSPAANFAFITLYDVTGADPNPFDTVGTASGQQTVNANLTTCSVTPTSSSGLIFGLLTVEFNTPNQSVGAGYIFDTVVNSLDSNNAGTLGTAASTLDEDAGFAHFYNTNTSTATFVYGLNTTGAAGGGSAGAQFWSSVAVAFKSGTPSLFLNVWDSPFAFWGGPPSGIDSTWDSTSNFWNDSQAFWNSFGLPAASVVAQPSSTIGLRSILLGLLNFWDSSSALWSDPIAPWSESGPSPRLIAQPTATLTPNLILTGWGLWDDTVRVWNSTADVWNEHGPFAQLLAQSTIVLGSGVAIKISITANANVPAGGGTTWNVACTLAIQSRLPRALLAAQAITQPTITVYSKAAIPGPGYGGVTWNGPDAADLWNSSATVWDAPDMAGYGDAWNSTGAFWDDTNAFWDSWGLPVAQLLAQGTDTVSIHAALSNEIAQAIHQATDAIAARVLFSTEVAQAVHQAVITIAPHVTFTEVAQLLAQGSGTIGLHAALSTEIAQSIHQATDAIAAKIALTEISTKAAGAIAAITSHIALTEVAQMLAQGTAVISSKASASTEVGKAIHQATDTLAPFITLFASANVPGGGGTTWNVTAVITLKILLSGPGISGDLWNGLATTWASSTTVWDSWLGTGDFWDSSTLPWNSTFNVWDSVGQPLSEVVAQPIATLSANTILASPVNTWGSVADFWSDPSTVWDAYLPTAQAVHQGTELIASKAALTELGNAILQPTATIATKIALTELATKLLSALSAIQSKVTLTALALRAATATAQISSHTTVTPVAQALHQALLSIVSRTGLSASAAAIFRPSVLIGARLLLVPNASGTSTLVFIRWDDGDPMSVMASGTGASVWDDMGTRFVPVSAPILSVWGDASTFWSDPAGVWDSARRRD
jgi:hypothetical protein